MWLAYNVLLLLFIIIQWEKRAIPIFQFYLKGFLAPYALGLTAALYANHTQRIYLYIAPDNHNFTIDPSILIKMMDNSVTLY